MSQVVPSSLNALKEISGVTVYYDTKENSFCARVKGLWVYRKDLTVLEKVLTADEPPVPCLIFGKWSHGIEQGIVIQEIVKKRNLKWIAANGISYEEGSVFLWDAEVFQELTALVAEYKALSLRWKKTIDLLGMLTDKEFEKARAALKKKRDEEGAAE